MEELLRISTGVPGLDMVLNGGLLAQRSYLIRGGPGTGKTTLGLHCLAAMPKNKRTLFLGLSEPVERIVRDAQAQGLDLSDVAWCDLTTSKDAFFEGESYDIFSPAEVERKPMTQQIIRMIEQVKPACVLIDSLTQLRYLSANSYDFRKQTLALIKYLNDQGATVLATSETSIEAPDDDVQFIVDGILEVDFQHGAATRRNEGRGFAGRGITAVKFRGSNFAPGRHELLIGDHGVQVFPRLVPAEHGQRFIAETISSGIDELDRITHGGLHRGTVTVITGPSGVGKTTLAVHYMKEAAKRGERSVIFSFDEGLATLIHRSESVGIPMQMMLADGILQTIAVEPLSMSADQFAHLVRQKVEHEQVRVVLIDSVRGYGLSVRGEDLVLHLHALCGYLKNMGVTVLLNDETDAIMDQAFHPTSVGVSYLASGVIYLRYVAIDNRLCRALGVLKIRTSDFENTQHEFQITRHGIVIGAALQSGTHGLLPGIPRMSRASEQQ
ncbi:MAG: hypothetical protein A3I66_04005 [Burkholderiales bacterium RIFCSPLOWO2_02_FULL_57_36]|nr:MAG: hypothetical protein A3I66_04005 [Burkholderiales bacterium RIFCSPLOWO2_02_FULL_57_36]